MFDLRDFRENSLKMTQTDFASLLGMRQDAISRLEKNPEQISLQILQTIAIRTGMTLDQLVAYEKPIPEALNVKCTWNNAKYVKKTLVDYIAKFSESYKDSEKTNYLPSIDELQKSVDNTIKKPKVVFMGRSDTGKSTMINALIGKNKMPTNWTPTTSIAVYIKHIEDRPPFIDEELWIFKKGEDGAEWDDSQLSNELYCRQWKLAGGSAEMLSSYGTRHGENYQCDRVGTAVLFIDSDILKNCDMLDVPGFTGGVASDNDIANKAKTKADVLVYLSQSIGFFSSEDCSNLKEAMNTLTILENSKDSRIPKLTNLFIVGTQAHTINHGNADELKKILDDGCERFYGTLTDKFWSDRNNATGYDYTIKDLRSRFFSYTTDIKSVRTDFENRLCEVIELLPELIKERSIEVIKDSCKTMVTEIDTDIEKYTGLINEREKYQNLLNELYKNEPLRKVKTTEQKKDIISFIFKINKNSRERFRAEYDRILSEEHIIATIKSKKYRSKKEDMQLLGSYLSSELKDALETVLERDSHVFKNRVDNFISDFNNNCKIENVSFEDFNMNNFNAKRAFASGLTGAATLGGLAFWASTLGNLGAYILVAKGVSLLSALGISVGGTSAVISAVASIGGPVVLGIVLAVITALGMFGVFSIGWEKKVAKKIREAYIEQAALSKYNTCIDNFWEDTEKAFSIAADNMEKEWQQHIMDLEITLNNYDVAKLQDCITKAEQIKTFFNNMPL